MSSRPRRKKATRGGSGARGISARPASIVELLQMLEGVAELSAEAGLAVEAAEAQLLADSIATRVERACAILRRHDLIA